MKYLILIVWLLTLFSCKSNQDIANDIQNCVNNGGQYGGLVTGTSDAAIICIGKHHDAK